MNLKATIISLISIFIVGLTAVLLYCFWPAIKGSVDNSKYYTQEELQESYDKGFKDGCKTETELLGQVQYYKDLVDEYYIQVNTLNDEIVMLTKSNLDYVTQVTALKAEVLTLNTIKTSNELMISTLSTQVAELENQVANLENSNEDKDEEIAHKNTQIINLQAIVSQLQRTNELNLETITNLNIQITSLNRQIADMTLQIQNNSANVSTLNNKIAELEKSVAYYEEYIASLENDEKVAVTFEFNGSVYNIQIVNKNDTVSVVTPTSTDYVIFNHWTVGGEQIDLSTYLITANTKIVADVTYKYDVVFMVDDIEYNRQVTIKDNYAVVPDTPAKAGYEFDGWTVDGLGIVNPETTAITSNTTFIAKFTKLHTVIFMYEDTVYETIIIRNNDYCADVAVNDTTYKVFNGWTLNGVIVDITNQKIVADTTFVADITYKYDVIFKVDDTEHNKQVIAYNSYVTLPEEPIKTGYEFDGWTLNGVDIINPRTIAITSNITFIAKFTKLHTVSFLVDGNIYYSGTVRDGNTITVPANPTKTNHKFTGWTLNNTVIENVSSHVITSDTTFVANFIESAMTINSLFDCYSNSQVTFEKIERTQSFVKFSTPVYKVTITDSRIKSTSTVNGVFGKVNAHYTIKVDTDGDGTFTYDANKKEELRKGTYSSDFSLSSLNDNTTTVALPTSYIKTGNSTPINIGLSITYTITDGQIVFSFSGPEYANASLGTLPYLTKYSSSSSSDVNGRSVGLDSIALNFTLEF